MSRSDCLSYRRAAIEAARKAGRLDRLAAVHELTGAERDAGRERAEARRWERRAGMLRARADRAVA